MKLALSVDKFEPFKYGANHSIWPVTLVMYNLLNWMSIKQPYFIMLLLISGPTTLCNEINVYLPPEGSIDERHLPEEFELYV